MIQHNSTMPQWFSTKMATSSENYVPKYYNYCFISDRLSVQEHAEAAQGYLSVRETSTPRTTARSAGPAQGEAASSTSVTAARSNLAGQDSPTAALSAEASSSSPRATTRDRRRPGSTRSSAGSAASHGWSAASSRARRASARTIAGGAKTTAARLGFHG